jgi:Ca-activated chloride channel family protein
MASDSRLRTGPLSRRLPFIVLTFASLSLVADEGGTELYIDQNRVSDQGIYRGTVELAILPSFPDARIAVSIDGHTVARALSAPYRVSVDLGPQPVEHIIEILSASPVGRRLHRWSTVINAGSKPLAVRLQPLGGTPRTFEASVTVPRGERIEAVEFYDELGAIARLTAPPWVAALPARSSGSVVTATARARSGVEATDVYSAGGDVHAASFDVRTVQLMVSITDQRGARQANLQAGSFEILDKGARAEILEVGRADGLPISIALLIDSSASITSEIRGVTRSATRFVKNLIRPQDRCAVFTIRTVPRREQPLTTDLGLIEDALANIKPMGRTAIFDGIRAALRELKGEEGRKAIVILTDGQDTSSISSYEEALQESKLAGVPVYVIAFNEADDYADDRDRLQFLAAETGGFLTGATAEDLNAKYTEIERELREQYTIRYQVTDVSRTNEWRDVRIRVKARDVVARTISGYFTP